MKTGDRSRAGRDCHNSAIRPASASADTRKALRPQCMPANRPGCRVMAGLPFREDRVPVGAEEQIKTRALHLDLAAARLHKKATTLLNVLASQASADQPAKCPATPEDHKGHRLLALFDIVLALKQHRS